MASVVWGVLAIILIVGGAALSANVGRAAERIVGGLRGHADDAPARVRRWRVLGMTYLSAGVLLLTIALLSR